MYRCPSQMRTVREASAKSRDRSSSCLTEPGTSTRAEWRARCWRGALLLFFHYILYTIHYTHTHPLFTPHTPHCSRFRVATILVQCTRVPKLG